MIIRAMPVRKAMPVHKGIRVVIKVIMEDTANRGRKAGRGVNVVIAETYDHCNLRNMPVLSGRMLSVE